MFWNIHEKFDGEQFLFKPTAENLKWSFHLDIL